MVPGARGGEEFQGGLAGGDPVQLEVQPIAELLEVVVGLGELQAGVEEDDGDVRLDGER